MDSDIVNEMASFDLSKPFSITVCDDEVIENTGDIKSIFFTNYDCPTRSICGEIELNNKSNNGIKEIKSKIPSVLRVLEEKTPEDFVQEKCVKKMKRKHKNYGKKSTSDKKIVKRTQKSLEPIEMEPTIETSPSDSVTENIVDNSKAKPKRGQAVKGDNSLKKDEKNNEINQYINDLLAKVSESLIRILEAYNNHVANVRQCNYNDPRFIQESKRQYTRLKQHFFQLSYCTTNIIILSKENDSQFTELFLKNTVKLAEMKNMKFTVQQIQPIYYELISWVKQKKEIQNLPLSIPVAMHELSKLRKQLSQDNVQPSNLSSNSCTITPKVSIHNSNSHNKEIRISLESNVQSNVTNSNKTPFCGLQQFNNKTARSKHFDTYSGFDQLRHTNFQMGHSSDYEAEHSYRANYSEVGANAVKDNIVKQCMASNCSCENQGHLGISNRNIRLPNNVEQSFQRKSLTNHAINQIEDVNALNNVDYTRSSVSCDSGFISPQQQISPLENMAQTVEDMQNTLVTPFITHVTSLNPKALQILEGSCHVCGASTKKKCLGCYQIYYCSYQCQRLDWGQHMNLCKSKLASQPVPN